jgi:hypothetical protein
VLHIACEGANGLGARKEAWRLHHIQGKRPAEIETIDAAPFFLCKETALDLIGDVDKVVADIVLQWGDAPIKIITIDTLNRSLKGSESSDEDMAGYIRAAVLLAEKFQCVVVIIHHCGWNEERPRGHSSLLGAVDVVIEVKKYNGKTIAEVEDMRDGPSGAVTVSRLQVVEVGRDDNLDPITSCVIVEDEITETTKRSTMTSPMARKFYDAVNQAGATWSEPRHASGGRASITMAQWIAQLQQSGLLPAIPSDTPNAERRKLENSRSARMSKYQQELIAADLIRVNGDIVWSIRAEPENGSKPLANCQM